MKQITKQIIITLCAEDVGPRRKKLNICGTAMNFQTNVQQKIVIWTKMMRKLSLKLTGASKNSWTITTNIRRCYLQ